MMYDEDYQDDNDRYDEDYYYWKYNHYEPDDDYDWRQSYNDAFDGQEDAYWNID